MHDLLVKLKQITTSTLQVVSKGAAAEEACVQLTTALHLQVHRKNVLPTSAIKRYAQRIKQMINYYNILKLTKY